MKKTSIFFLLAAVLTLTACSKSNEGITEQPDNSATSEPEAAAANPALLTAEEAYERMQSGDDLIILDVRTTAEYEEAHIPGAILIPNETISDTKPELLPDTDAEILVYCRSGNRSAQAAEKLAKMGYTKIYDFGGINSWPYEVESGAWEEVDNEINEE